MRAFQLRRFLDPGDSLIVSYAPSATVLSYLRHLPAIDTEGGILAVGDPDFGRPAETAVSAALPDHGLLVDVVYGSSNAAKHGLNVDDVLLSYNSSKLRNRGDLKAVAASNAPIPVEIWREGKILRSEVGPGRLGVIFDSRPVDVAIKASAD